MKNKKSTKEVLWLQSGYGDKIFIRTNDGINEEYKIPEEVEKAYYRMVEFINDGYVRVNCL